MTSRISDRDLDLAKQQMFNGTKPKQPDRVTRLEIYTRGEKNERFN
jgi:hypothetical protein